MEKSGTKSSAHTGTVPEVGFRVGFFFFPNAWGESSTILYLASSCSLLARWDPEAELIHTSIFIVCYALYLSGSPIFSPNIEELHYHRDTQIDNFSAERRWMGEERRLEIS